MTVCFLRVVSKVVLVDERISEGADFVEIAGKEGNSEFLLGVVDTLA